MIFLPDGTDTAGVLQRVRDRGYLLADLADYTVTTERHPRPAIVLGYADASLNDLTAAIKALASECHREPSASVRRG